MDKILVKTFHYEKTKLNIEKLIFCLALFLPCVNAALSLFKIDYILYYYCLISVLLIINSLCRFNVVIDLIKILLLIIIFAFNYVCYGLYYVTHQDFYGVFFLIVVLFFSPSPKSFKNYFYELKSVIKISTLIYLGLLFVSLFYGKGYDIFSSYQTYKVLFGPYNLSHTLSYELIFYLIINWVAFKFSLKNIIVLSILFVSLLLTQVRTAFLAVLVIILFEILYAKSLNKEQKKLIYAIILFCVFLFALAYYAGWLENIPFLSKTIASAESGSVSNGRELYVEIACRYYNNFDFSKKLFGASMDIVRAIFLKEINVDIHCHNDIFNLLLGYGLIGLILVLVSILSFVKSNNRLFFLIFIMVFIWYNGLYMYLNFVFLLPIIRAIYFQKNTKSQGVYNGTANSSK